ncbi:OrfI protein [Moritella sp. JT01]|uniref:AbiV family abortive infection protein n=1 Tax=Moritella sp. JT01 TaxID=756698 RepID=UPI0007952676|nr:AbiV family abortive infection protein [Moritella sp. JT01]KXO13311.1 OrfI protein [Moritella sp. JT01]
MEVIELIYSLVRSEERLIRSVEEMDKAIGHAVTLIQDSSCLYLNGSYSSSVFLSITVLEEVAKAHVGAFTGGNHPVKNRNVFKDHKTKHILAAFPTVAMGKRLQDAIGEKEIDRLINMAKNSGLVQAREFSLYFQRENGKLKVPADKVNRKFARSILLFAIEVFDDALGGVTNYSNEAAEVTDELFEQVKNT